MNRAEDRKKFVLLKTVLNAEKATAADVEGYYFSSAGKRTPFEAKTRCCRGVRQGLTCEVVLSLDQLSGFKGGATAVLKSSLILEFSWVRQWRNI